MLTAEQKQAAALKLAEEEGLDAAEAQDLVDAIMQSADFSQLAPEDSGEMVTEQSPEDWGTAAVPEEPEPYLSEEAELESQMLDQEMYADHALVNGDQEALDRASTLYSVSAKRLAELKQKKTAAPYSPPAQRNLYNPNAANSGEAPGGGQSVDPMGPNPAGGGPEQQGAMGMSCPSCNSVNLNSMGQAHECLDCGTQFDVPMQGQALASLKKTHEGVEDGVLRQAIKKASRFTRDPVHLSNIVKFFLGSSNQRSTYAALRNLDTPLVCPACSRKVARSSKNPMHFSCEFGHISELNLEKVAYGPNDLPPLSQEESDGMDEARYEMGPEASVEEEPVPETPATPGTLSQDQKNRLNAALYEAQGESATPLYLLGVVDEFFGTELFGQLAVSSDESAEYKSGQKKGQEARGGVSNIAEF